MFYLDVVYFIFYILFCVDINFFFGEKISKLKKKNAISKSNEIKKKKNSPNTH